MAQQTINLGSFPNATDDDDLRTGGAKINANFDELYALQSRTLNAADPQFGGATNEISIQNMMNYGHAIGAERGFIPATMLPFDASGMTFYPDFRLVREGGDFTVYDVRAYGAAGNDVQIDDANFVAADAQAKLAGGTLNIPDCDVAYKITTTIPVSGNNRRWRQDPAGLIKSYVASGPAIHFAGQTMPMQFLQVEGLRIKRAVDGYRQPLVQFGDANGLSYFSVRDVLLDGSDAVGDSLWIHTAYDGAFYNVSQIAAGGGVGVTYRNDPATNVGNINFFNCNNNTSPIQFLIQEYYGVATNLINSLHFDNCKFASAANTFAKYFSGTADAAAGSGASSITVSAGQGANYTSGDWITIVQVAGNLLTVSKVSSVVGDTLNLTGSLPFAISLNDPIINGGWQCVIGQNVKNLRFDIPHWERTNGILGVGVADVEINGALLGVNVFRGVYLVRGCQMWTLSKPRGTGSSGTILLHQGNDTGNSRNAIDGTVQNDFAGTAPTLFQVDGGSAVGINRRFGLQESLIGVWHQDTTVAANQSAVMLTGPMGATRSVRMSMRGVLTRLVAAVSSARTTGTLTAIVFLNGSATTLTAIIDGTNTVWKITEVIAIGSLNFVPGDNIDVRVTTDGTWAPTANNLDVQLFATI